LTNLLLFRALSLSAYIYNHIDDDEKQNANDRNDAWPLPGTLFSLFFFFFVFYLFIHLLLLFDDDDDEKNDGSETVVFR